jgi:hypothetical protein
VVSWGSVPTLNTLKIISCGTVFLINMPTSSAFLTGVARIDVNHQNSCQLHFVIDKLAELVKVPKNGVDDAATF